MIHTEGGEPLCPPEEAQVAVSKHQDALKERGIYLGWIAGLLLIGGGIWFFTQAARAAALQQRVNQVLESIQDPRRLEERSPGPAAFGHWYTLSDSEDRAVVFPLMHNGVFIPCLAVVSSRTGTVADAAFVPLTAHPEQTRKGLPAGLVTLYMRRIENAVSKQGVLRP
ncbi:MAG: hypothetical protein LBD74_00355 [Spirochaetaceae bacterium]|jgi:hypothetical protein|nr:hypothetical protein [Spirochaetaceae bacterium]